MALPSDTEGGTVWLSVPEAARYLGISERAVRKRIGANTIPAEREGGGPWRVQVSTAKAAPGGTESGPTRGTGAAPGGTNGGTQAEPIEAAYRVAGEVAAEVALVPLATMVEELRGLAEQLQQMSQRNEALALEVGQLRERQVGHTVQLAAKDEALAAKDETIAELRRRAETAEVERERLIAAQAAQVPQEAPQVAQDTATAEDMAGGVWARLGRWWRG